MERKTAFGIVLTLLLIGTLTLTFNIQPVKASGTIYIKADGSVEGTDKIQRDGDIYTFTDNIYDSIVIERDNIVINGVGYTVQGGGTGIDLSGRTNVTVRNIKITAFSYGIYLASSSHNHITSNNITNNGNGIFSGGYSNYNDISENSITANNWGGIVLYYSSNNNIITGNSITGHNQNGILVYDSFNNIIQQNRITANSGNGIALYSFSENNIINGNRIANNENGIFLENSLQNLNYHNNFADNNQQVYIPTSDYNNVWDDGYPSGGNYWSDYTDRYPEGKELDDSGIWDTPYVIDENNQDNYPLVEPWSPKPSTPSEALEELIETIDIWDLPKGTENSLTSKLEGALHLLDIGNENGAIHKLMDFINQFEAQRGKKLNDDQADYLIAEAQRIISLIEG